MRLAFAWPWARKLAMSCAWWLSREKAGGARTGAWISGLVRANETADCLVVRGNETRPTHIRCGLGAAVRGGVTRLLHPRAPRHENRSVDRVALRVKN